VRSPRGLWRTGLGGPPGEGPSVPEKRYPHGPDKTALAYTWERAQRAKANPGLEAIVTRDKLPTTFLSVMIGPLFFWADGAT
jgi:hypothetical protein